MSIYDFCSVLQLFMYLKPRELDYFPDIMRDGKGQGVALRGQTLFLTDPGPPNPPALVDR